MDVPYSKRTSFLAIASFVCVIAAIISIILFGLTVALPMGDVGHFILFAMILFPAAFVLGIISVVVITIRRKYLKGYILAILAIILSIPMIYLDHKVGLGIKYRMERSKLYTGRYNLDLLGKGLKKYAKSHNGCLPDANSWCDQLLADKELGLTPDNFCHPRKQELGLEGKCSFAFNKNLGGKRLVDIPGDVVLIFEADGDWNLNGTSGILQERRTTAVDEYYIDMLFADQTIKAFWFNEQAIKKFNKKGTYMYYEAPRWEP
jgi:hypothetical protein